VNIHEAKTQRSKLVEQAANGEPFVIAKAGRPMVQVVAIPVGTPAVPKRFGFMAGQFSVPDDFDTMMADPENQLYFSAASIWEVAVKTALKKAAFPVDLYLFWRTLSDNDYQELAISSRHGSAAGGLPPIHKDPFDRILVAQATVEGMLLLTAHAKLAEYPGPIRLV